MIFLRYQFGNMIQVGFGDELASTNDVNDVRENNMRLIESPKSTERSKSD